ncbi:MAG: hypothetical protein RIA64_14610 [Rhodospirillales bacterium]
MKKLALLLSLIPVAATAAMLPDVKRPDFSASREVVASLEAMISELRTAAKGAPSSWQVGRALGNCQEVRRTVAHWPSVDAYDPRGAERLWKECKSTYDAVR